MVNIIIGENCLGKTKKLLELSRNEMEYVCNIATSITNKIVKLSEEKVLYLQENCDVKEVKTTADEVAYFEFDDGLMQYTSSSELVKIVSLLCKDCKVYLDEPEKKLSEDDIEVLRSILDFWNDKWDVWITTHSNALVAIENAKYFTVKGNTLVSVPFGEIYEYFDKK